MLYVQCQVKTPHNEIASGRDGAVPSLLFDGNVDMPNSDGVKNVGLI